MATSFILDETRSVRVLLWIGLTTNSKECDLELQRQSFSCLFCMNIVCYTWTFLFQYIRVQADQLRFGKTCKRMLQIYLNQKSWLVRIRSITDIKTFSTTVPLISWVLILHESSSSLDLRFLVARHPEIERLAVRRVGLFWNDWINDDRIVQHMRPSSLMDPEKSSGKTFF